MTAPLSTIATEYGLTVNEAERALRWAQVAKEVAQKPNRPKLYMKLDEPKVSTERVWCDQCQRNRLIADAEACTWKHCKAKAA